MSEKVTVINGVTYTDTFVDDVLVSTVWVNSDGTGEVSRTTDGASGDVTEITTWTNVGESDASLSSTYVYDSGGAFKGGTKSENGVTYTYDSSWAITQTTYDLLLISSDVFTSAFGNASDVSSLFGLEQADIQFQITNSWQDESNSLNSGKDVSFFNKTTGAKLGVMYVNNGSWSDNGETVRSININFDSVDGSGDQQWLGGSWTNYDSDGDLRDSGSNSRTTVEYSTVTAPSGLTLPGGITLVDATEIIVESGSNTWTDPQGETFSSENTRYYTEVEGDQVFLWETQTQNGITTAYDSTWTQVGKSQASLDSLTAVAAESSVQEIADNAASLESLFGSDIKFLLVNEWADQQNTDNSGKEYGIFDSSGLKLGSMNVNKGSWTDNGTNEKVLSTNVGFNTIDANGEWQWLGGSWKNYDSESGDLRDSGSNTRATEAVDADFLAGVPTELVSTLEGYSSVVVETGSNTWKDPAGESRTSTFTRYFADVDGEQKFVGGTDTQDGVTRTVDGSWNQLGQPSVDTSKLPTIGADEYTAAYGNAAKVLALFGSADATASDVLYKITNAWQDESNPDNKGTDISFFDAETGSKLGDMYVNQGSWFDNGEKILSTNIGFNSMDANGDWQWLGGSWANYDSSNVLRDSGSNSRTTVEYSTVTAPSGLTLPGGITLVDATEIIVESGSNTWTDPQGETFSSENTRYYTEVEGDQVFLWETQTQNGITTAYDSTWTQVGKSQASLDSLTAVAAESSVQEIADNAASLESLFGSDIKFLLVNEWADQQNTDNSGKEYGIFDSSGLKLGSMNVNKGSWTDNGTNEKVLSTNVGFNTIDANGEWQWLGGSWKNYDSESGDLRDSGSNTRATEAVDADFLAGVPTELVSTLEGYSSVVVETGSNTWKDPAGESRTSTFTRYFADDDGEQKFVGGTDTQDGVTRTVDGSWNQLGQPSVDTSKLPTIGADEYTAAYDNAADVLALFGSADATASDVLYKITNAWQDESNPDNKGTDISFFDAETGSKLGDMYVNQGSWFDNGEKILSTNIGFNSMDANGDWQWLGGSWANYDSSNVLRDSGSNSRTTVEYSTVTAPSGLTLPGGITLVDATEIIVESGSNTWTDPQGETFSSENTRYYTEVEGDQVFLWETQTQNGITTAYDSTWTQVGKSQASLDSLTAVAAESSVQEIADNAASLESLFGSDIKFLLVNEWADQQNTDNSGKEYGIFDSSGLKLGSMNVNKGSWTDNGTNEKVLSTNVGFNTIDANGEWQWLGGSWKNYDSESGDLRDSGSNTRATEAVDADFLAGVPTELVSTLEGYSSVVVETGSNTWKDPAGESRTSTFTRYFADDDGEQKFVGGTDTQDGVTRTVDGSWNQLGQPSVDTSKLPTIGADEYTAAYDNAADVLALFGSADATASDVLYKITNAWQDESNPDNKGTDISFFDAETGSKLGDMYVNQGSWFDNGEKILSTNIGFNSMDANGEWQWLGGSWANYDSSNVLRDSGSNSRTTVEYSTVTAPSGLTLPGGITLVDATEIIVESGSNTWTDPQGETFSSENTRYYTEVEGDQVFLWETQTQNGITTAYDSTWTQVGKSQASLDSLTAVAAESSVQEIADNAASLESLFGSDIKFLLVNEWTDQQNTDNSGKEYGIFDSSGLKLGSMNVNKGSWTDNGTNEKVLSTNVGFNTIDANGEWQWLGGSWKNYDSESGDLRDSGSNTRVTQAVDAAFLTGVPTELADTLGSYASVVVETGSNTWKDPAGESRTSTFTRYFGDDQFDNEIFLGGTDTQDGVTRTVDGSWNQLGQPSVDTSALLTIGVAVVDGVEVDTYGDTYGNAAKVLALFGAADATTSDILYKITNGWQDGENSFSEISFFAKGSGAKLGLMFMDKRSWFDNGEAIVSTNINFDSVDENGGQQWVASSWANYDSSNVLRDSGSNSRTTVEYSTVTAPSGLTLPGGITLVDATEIIVESGSNTWTDPQGETFSSENTRYYTEVEGDQVFLWETQTQNGITTAYDSTWTQVGKSQASLDSLTAVAAESSVAEIADNAASLESLFGSDIKFLLVNEWTDQQNTDNSGKEYGIFDSSGLKLGSMNVNKGSWTDNGTNEKVLSTNVGFNTIDANGEWQWLGGSWKNYDSESGDLRDSGSNTRVTQAVDAAFLTGVPTELADTLGSYASVVVETGSNTWKDPAGESRTSTFTRYFGDDQFDNEIFLGGTDTQDGVTRTVDGSWNQLGQPSVDTSKLPTIGADEYTAAYGNAAKVLALFGSADATASDVLYKITNGWQDGEDSFSEVSFFAKESGAKLGLMFVDKRSRVDNGEAIVSTNINFDSVDENGGQQWVAGSFTDYSGEVLLNSGSNTRTTSLVADLTDVPSEIDLTGYTEVVVESGTNTWLDAQGQYRTWTFTKYFELSESGQFLGEIGTGSDGFSRVIDKNGNEYSSNSSNNGEWTTIQADTYSLDLPPASWGGWNLQVKGTGESETLDLAAIAVEQGLAADGINVDAIYTRISGAGGNDKLYGAGGLDSLRVHFDGSNLVDGRTNPSYLGSDGNFFSAHDRYVIYQDVTSREEWYQGDYVLLGVGAIVAQSAGNADVALKDLATSAALQIDSFVNLMSGELEDMSQLPSLLSQVAEKAVLLGIGDMLLGDLTSLMLKVQSVSEEGDISVEVDFIKDIDMVSVIGVLEDGSEFTADQVFINPVEYTLTGDDNFSNPYSLGVRGSYQGTNAGDQVDRSGENSGVGYSFRMGDGDDVVVGTDYDDVINLQGGGTKTIDGGLGNDAADINIIGMWDDGGGYGLNVEFDEGTRTYTVFDTYAENMEKMLTVSPNEAGGWSAISTDYAKQKFYLSDANLTNVESIRIFIGTDPDNNNEAVYRTLDLSQAESWTTIQTDTYSLDLPPASWGGWSLGLRGTSESETLDLAAIAEEQGLASQGIDVNTIYTRVFGDGGNDKLYGAGGMDSLRVDFEFSNFLDGRTNPSYLGSDGDFFSAHDRYVIFQKVGVPENFDKGNYILIGVGAIVAQSAGNADVALKDLATSAALQIDSFVNLMSGESEDMSQLPSLLSQVAEKAVLLGIGDMLLGDLTSLMLKVQSVSEEGDISVEVDFIKDIDMVSLLGVLEDGSSFTADQVSINPIAFELSGDDSFPDYALGTKGRYLGTNATDKVDYSGKSVGYSFSTFGGNDELVGTNNADIFDLDVGDKNIDGGLGNDAADINIIGMLADGHSLTVNFDSATMTYTVFDTTTTVGIDGASSISDEMLFTAVLQNDNSWRVVSTSLGKEKFNLGDATLKSVESIRVFHAIENDEPVYKSLDLLVPEEWTSIETDSYTLNLPPASWGGWSLGLRGTSESETLDLAAIAEEQGLASQGIDVNTIYTRVFGDGGNDKLYGAGGMDSLRVDFEFSNFLDGRTNPSYLGSDGDFFSAHDRYVIFQKVGVPENFDKGNYILIGVGAIVAQSAGNADVALKDLATSAALQIDSFVNLMSGESEDMSQLPSLLSQVAEKAVLLGIGDMLLGDLTSLMLKVQSVSEEGDISVEVDFIKDIDMVSLLGVLEDGSSFTADQVSINPIAFELSGDDSFPDYALGTKGRYLGTNATDKVDYSGKSVGYSFSTFGGNDELVGTNNADIFDLDVGDKNIDGGLGNDAADINIIGMLADGHSLTVNFDSATMTYTVFDTTTTVGIDGASSISDEMLFTAVLQNDNSWRVVSTSLGKEKFNLGDATLKSVESIRVFHAIENDEPVYKSLDLLVPEEWTSIETDSYTLNLPPASWGGWNLQVKGTGESETLDLAAIALEQDLAADGINVDAIYTGIYGAGGNDKLYGAGGMDSLRVHFDGSNLVDGRTNPSYLGSDGNFFSAHDRYVIFQDVTSREEWYQGDYVLLGVGAIVAQSAGNADVALKDLATSAALQIDSFVNLMSGELEDMSQLPSLLSQVAEKAVLLGIGDMLLGDLTSLMLKVQSVSEEGDISVEVDFIKDIDMVTVVGVLEDGSEFTADQVFINPVEYTLTGDDNFSNPNSLGVRGSYQGTNAGDQVDRSGENSGVGYSFRMGDGDDVVVGTDYDDVINLQGGGTKTIDGGLGNDAADINIIGMWDDGGGYGLNVEFDEGTGTYTVFDTYADNMEKMLTVSPNEAGGWSAISTDYAKQKFYLSDAKLTNVESIRIFIGTDPDNNNEAVYETLGLVGVMPVQDV